MYYLDSVISTINSFIEKGMKFISTKHIRCFQGLDSSEKAKINFIWRNLEYLEEQGYIELYQETPRKIYRLPENKIQIEG